MKDQVAEVSKTEEKKPWFTNLFQAINFLEHNSRVFRDDKDPKLLKIVNGSAGLKCLGAADYLRSLGFKIIFI